MGDRCTTQLAKISIDRKFKTFTAEVVRIVLFLSSSMDVCVLAAEYYVLHVFCCFALQYTNILEMDGNIMTDCNSNLLVVPNFLFRVVHHGTHPNTSSTACFYTLPSTQ